MKDLETLKDMLLRVPQFTGLPAEALEPLAAAALCQRFAAGQVIYLEGEPANAIYVLQAGWIKATRMTLDGREQAMMFLDPVDIFGEAAVFTGQPYPCTVTALEDVTAWAIPTQAVLDLLQRRPEFALAVARRLGGRVLHYVSLVEDLALRSVEARLAHTLLQHAELDDGRLVVWRRTWTTFDQMAVRLGTVRDVLSRALKTLEAENLLKVEKQTILLIDPKGLAERGER